MGFFDIFKRHGNGIQAEPAPAPSSSSKPYEPVPEFNGVQMLDLHKGDILDLNKYSTDLRMVRASAGWKINQNRKRENDYDFDLDLCAYLVNGNGAIEDTVYYGDKRAHGVRLDQDNLVGTTSGDAENIDIQLDKVDSCVQEIYLAVVIYEASSRRQYFSEVRDAYVRLADTGAGGKEICRFRMTEDGGTNTAVLAAKLKRNGSSWAFEAIGRYSKDSIGSLGRHLN